MKPQIHLQVDRLMQTYQLGQEIASYRGEWRMAKKLSIGGGLIIALAIVAALSWGMISTLGRTPGEAATVITSVTCIVFLIFVVVLVYIWIDTVSYRDVFLYEEGFVSVQGHKVRAVRWDEVETFTEVRSQPIFIELIWYVLRRGAFSSPPNPFSVCTKQGVTFHWNRTFINLSHVRPFTDIEERLHAEAELAKCMEREISMRLWKKAEATYQAGFPVIFHGIYISQQGIGGKRDVFS